MILRAAPGTLRVKNSDERNAQTGTGYKAPRESSLEKIIRQKIWSWYPPVLEKRRKREKCVWREM